MIRILPVFLFLESLSILAFAQNHQRDTSFSVYSTFIKTQKNYPGISIANPATPPDIKIKKSIVYRTVNTRKLVLDVFYPRKKQSNGYPAILMVHGGGWRSGDHSHNTPTAKLLAANGYVAVSAEYRLSTEAIYPAAVHDLKAAIRWMRGHAKKYNIDTSRVAAWGCSAGGQLAALLGTTNGNKRLEGKGAYSGYSSKVQAVVDVDGILAFIHPQSGEGDDSKGKSAATQWFGYSKTERPDLWKDASALTHVSAKAPPTCFINSSVGRMHAGRDDMIKRLNLWNIYNETHTFPDAPHPFWLFNPWFQPTVDYTLSFLNMVFKSK